MKCCPLCFGDAGLGSHITFISNNSGDCDFCNAVGQPLVGPAELADLFGSLVGVYEEDESGQSLVQLLQSDWALFLSLNNHTAQVLLGEILDDGNISRRFYKLSDYYKSSGIGDWEALTEELRHANRFFPGCFIDLDQLERRLSTLLIKSVDLLTKWYRARIQLDDNTFEQGEMLAPPAKLTSHGRANPAGIPYLYLASTVATAVTEIKPHVGEYLSVAELIVPEELKLVDIRKPRLTVSPFLLADETDIGRMSQDLDFLEQIGYELTRPVRPIQAAFDYSPSQYICEFIKKCGYDGVVYNSSLGEGFNMALFKHDKVVIKEVNRFRADKVVVEFRQA